MASTHPYALLYMTEKYLRVTDLIKKKKTTFFLTSESVWMNQRNGIKNKNVVLI